MSFKLFAPTVIDLYKPGHINMYPEGCEYLYCNITPRSFKHMPAACLDKLHVIVFGLQAALKDIHDLWNETFFALPREEAVAQTKLEIESAIGPAQVSVEALGRLHDLGYLPLKIKALPEGSRVPINIPVATFINTIKGFHWLAPYMETQLSASSWHAMTVATLAYNYRLLFDMYAAQTGSPLDFVSWQGHDFSARGIGGNMASAIASMGHVLFFYGSDTLSSVRAAEYFYGPSRKEYFYAGSVPASEHSVVCAGGQDDEETTFLRIITELYPCGVVSYVSDTWSLWDVLALARKHKDKILARTPDANGLAKVVFRPDSGYPPDIICGDPDAEPGSDAHKGALQILWEIFGGTVTDKGYKVLHPRVGLIYGDSMSLNMSQEMLQRMVAIGFASCNLVFGIGSYSYQYLTRDSLGIAFKATHSVINGQASAMQKNPITDTGFKRSARGLLCVVRDPVTGEYSLEQDVTPEREEQGELRLAWLNSVQHNAVDFPTVRKRLGFLV